MIFTAIYHTTYFLEGVKYFSGVGTYSNAFQVPAEWLEDGKEIWLDLGDVKYVAEVSINGEPLGIAWKTPYHVNITSALQEGENAMEVRVSNLWINRLIGDLQPGVTTPVAFAAQHTYNANSPLVPSGLLGPVQIISITAQQQ